MQRIILSNSYDINHNDYFVDPRNGMWGKIESDHTICYMGNCGLDEKGRGKYIDLVKQGDELYFVPGCQDGKVTVKIFDIQTETFTEMVLKSEESCRISERPLFIRGLCIDKYVFLIGLSYPSIVRINTTTKKTDYISKWNTEVADKRKHLDEYGYTGFVSSQYILKDQELYLPFALTKGILILNINTLEERVVYLDVSSDGFSSICHLNEDLFVLAGCGEDRNWLYIWNEKKNEVIHKTRIQQCEDPCPVFRILPINTQEVLVFPWQNWNNCDLDILKYRWVDSALEKTGLLDAGFEECGAECLWGDAVVYVGWKDKESVVFITGRDLLLHCYNLKNHEKSIIWFKVKKNGEAYDKSIAEYIHEYVRNKAPIQETYISCSEFVEGIAADI